MSNCCWSGGACPPSAAHPRRTGCLCHRLSTFVGAPQNCVTPTTAPASISRCRRGSATLGEDASTDKAAPPGQCRADAAAGGVGCGGAGSRYRTSADAGGRSVSGGAVGWDVSANACCNAGRTSASRTCGEKLRSLITAAFRTSEPAETLGVDSPDGSSGTAETPGAGSPDGSTGDTSASGAGSPDGSTGNTSASGSSWPKGTAETPDGDGGGVGSVGGSRKRTRL